MRGPLAALLLLALPAGVSAQPSPGPSTGSAESPAPTASPSPTLTEAQRVAAALATLTTDEALVGQLLLLSWDGSTVASVRRVIADLRPGGVVFVTNAKRAAKARKLNAAIATAATELGVVPLLRAIDHEGGIVQRIKDVPNLGSAGAFGRSRPTSAAACRRGAAHGAELRAMGFDLSLGPVLDVATNPANPVIGDRAFGRRAAQVARLGAAYIQGLQGQGVLGSAKHFPGHGDTSVDSHLGLPVILDGRERLDAVELVPFRRAIAPDVSVASVMIGHLALPRLDPSGSPASLSAPIITGLLRQELGWDGLVVTDDLGAMDAITDGFGPGEAAVRAVEAGADLLIIVRDGANQVQARDALVAALRDGRLSRDHVEAAVRRVLAAKARVGLLAGVAPPIVACAATRS